MYHLILKTIQPPPLVILILISICKCEEGRLETWCHILQLNLEMNVMVAVLSEFVDDWGRVKNNGIWIVGHGSSCYWWKSLMWAQASANSISAHWIGQSLSEVASVPLRVRATWYSPKCSVTLELRLQFDRFQYSSGPVPLGYVHIQFSFRLPFKRRTPPGLWNNYQSCLPSACRAGNAPVSSLNPCSHLVETACQQWGTQYIIEFNGKIVLI